jgi:hypothetical protein
MSAPHHRPPLPLACLLPSLIYPHPPTRTAGDMLAGDACDAAGAGLWGETRSVLVCGGDDDVCEQGGADVGDEQFGGATAAVVASVIVI